MKTKVAFFLVVAFVLGACGGQNPIAPTQAPAQPTQLTPRPLEPTMSVEDAVGTAVAATVSAMDIPEVGGVSDSQLNSAMNSSSEPMSSVKQSTPEAGVPGYSISGVPANVDPSNILRAQGEDAYGNVLNNTLGLGTEMLLADKGTALVGPDIDPQKVKDAHGSLAYISPTNQFTLNNPGETDANAAEGAFLWFTGATVKAEVRGVSIQLDGMEGHNWFLMIRGLFADNTQDSDRNSTVHFTDYVPGHAQVMLYPAGAYISEGNFTQVAELSHTSGTNCGHEGCSGLTVMMLDLNTGAWTVVHQSQLDAPWEFVASNWR